jgi:hypothetical protein
MGNLELAIERRRACCRLNCPAENAVSNCLQTHVFSADFRVAADVNRGGILRG